MTKKILNSKNQKSFNLKGKVYIWPGGNPLHFIYVDGTEKDKIKKIGKKHHIGMIRVEVSLGNSVWQTSLLPFRKEDCYLLAIKKDIRRKENIFLGDEIRVFLRLI